MEEEAKQVKKRSDELLKKQIEEDRKRYEKIESRIVEKKDNIEKKYEDLINEDFFNPPVTGYWFLATIIFSLIYYAIGYFSEQIDYKDPTVYIVIAILSFPFSLVSRNYFGYRRKESSKYKSLIQQKNNEIESMINLYRSGKVIIECPNCYQNLRVPINKKLNVHCPECQRNFEIVT